jgi:RNA polymerase sigma-70 factor, ECF subfamily
MVRREAEGRFAKSQRPEFGLWQNSTMDAETARRSDLFQALYDANRQRVLRLLAGIAGPQNAEDLTQIVFAKAAKALPQFRGDAQASTWLYRIAANTASDWLRSRSAHVANLTVQLSEVADGETGPGNASSALVDLESSPEQQLARKDIRNCILGEIGKLPKGQREVLVLGELGGLSDEEMAQALGISRSNVKVRLHRARAQMKKAIEARCDFWRTELSCSPSSPGCCPPATVPNGAPSDR